MNYSDGKRSHSACKSFYFIEFVTVVYTSDPLFYFYHPGLIIKYRKHNNAFNCDFNSKQFFLHHIWHINVVFSDISLKNIQKLMIFI